jgi:NAD(P)-dependent dehydrogenase (short-subunit alcohol dehydrogenase family)
MDSGISRRTAISGLGAAVAWPIVREQTQQAAPTRSLSGRVALVTGSGANLGRSTVLELARRGADVVVNARTSRDEAEAVAAEARGFEVRAIALLADVGNEQQVNAMVAEALRQFGRIDILVNNAGFRGQSPIASMTTEQWRAAMAVNTDGPFYCTRAVVPSMIANRWGRIITVSGENSINGRQDWAHICASKMGAWGMTMALAVELAQYNILVNHVVPGAWDLDATTLAEIGQSPLANGVPLGRVGYPQELANVYAFLASDDASYITGQTIRVNGGQRRG